MYMRDAPEGGRDVTVGLLTKAGLTIAAAGTIAIGLVPAITSMVYDAALKAASALLGA